MSAHTPGPWGRNIKPASKYPTVYAGRNTHVAQVVSRGLTDAEIEANCDLIAAAPELLFALRALLRRAKDELSDPQDVHEVAVAESVIARLDGAA